MAAAIFLLVWPVYSGFDGNGNLTTRATLLQVNGPWVILLVIFPVLVALLPLIFRNQMTRIIATILIGGFAIISGFSIGLMYLPAAVMMLAACVAPTPKSRDVLP